MSLEGKSVLVTGSARRVGRELALAVAQAGGNLFIHHAHSQIEAEETAEEAQALGVKVWILQKDLGQPENGTELVREAIRISPLFAVVNNAAIFNPIDFETSSLKDWQDHLNLNLLTPFFISKEFFQTISENRKGRIVNILDWHALRPGRSHLPYMISKSALAALTRSLAISFAPNVNVNGLALGAILSPADGSDASPLIRNIPQKRWALPGEVGQALQFFLDGPEYITGEILHVDGGRHLI